MKFARLLVLLVLVCGCSQRPHADHKIGRDPTWYPHNFGTQESALNGFLNALIAAIAKEADTTITIADTDWISLYQGLGTDYGTTLSTLPLNVENQEKYTFSDPLLLIGPVLVVPKTSSATSLSDLQEKIVGISPYNDSVYLVQKHPSLIIRHVTNMPNALDALAAGTLDALLIPQLEAHALVPLHPSLHIASPPLTTDGIRLAAPKDEQTHFLTRFNKALASVRSSSTYTSLLKEFHLQQ